MNGRYDLSMPELSWAVGVVDLNRSDYWSATLHFATIYATDVFFSFEEMKMAAPGLSCQAFVRMLDQRTVRFGRESLIFINHFPYYRSVEEVFAEGSGQQPERPPKDQQAR
ncbi:hypothetical protein G5714_009705 [Onychostoma macrolepis]|uniref:Uncharacterized protein n=1 Tax=Onychostoma macrolepis TaxID=369639 RepID=A0A7J6CV76_9TELE|nr:hypothetical protein G5714_009705 [Onychostoma macrolepis]